jgi:hypothetical protein
MSLKPKNPKSKKKPTTKLSPNEYGHPPQEITYNGLIYQWIGSAGVEEKAKIIVAQQKRKWSKAKFLILPFHGSRPFVIYMHN